MNIDFSHIDDRVLFIMPVMEDIIKAVKEKTIFDSIVDLIKSSNYIPNCSKKRLILYITMGIAIFAIHSLWLYILIQIIRTKKWSTEERRKKDRTSLSIVPNKNTTIFRVIHSINIFWYVMMSFLIIGFITLCVSSIVNLFMSNCYNSRDSFIVALVFLVIATAVLFIICISFIAPVIKIIRSARKAKQSFNKYNQHIFSQIESTSAQIAKNKGPNGVEQTIATIFESVPSNVNPKILSKIIFTLSLYKYYVETYKSSSEDGFIIEALNAMNLRGLGTQKLFKRNAACYEYMYRGRLLTLLTDDPSFRKKYIKQISEKTYYEAKMLANKNMTEGRRIQSECDKTLESTRLSKLIQKIYIVLMILLPFVFYFIPIIGLIYKKYFIST